jgi:flagellar hook assembly protein FlgD
VGLFTLRPKQTGWKWDTIGSLHNKKIQDIAIDDYNNKWVATDQDGLVRIDGLCSFNTAVSSPIPADQTYYMKSALVLSEDVRRITGRAIKTAIWCDLEYNSKIRIYTLSGKLVKTIKVDENTEEWDGLNDEKRAVAGGIYIFYIVEPDGGKSMGKLMVLR